MITKLIYLLFCFYSENSLELKHLASDARYENPKLAQLQSRLLEEFQDTSSRGIIFSKTRRGTHCLNDWVKSNPELRRVNITAGILTGAGTGANNMTQVLVGKTICQKCYICYKNAQDSRVLKTSQGKTLQVNQVKNKN